MARFIQYYGKKGQIFFVDQRWQGMLLLTRSLFKINVFWLDLVNAGFYTACHARTHEGMAQRRL
jgi:hypothetical protein